MNFEGRSAGVSIEESDNERFLKWGDRRKPAD